VIVRTPRPARHIVGAFQFSVLVQTRHEILPIVERTLGNLRRVVATIPHENRWYPVIQRYLSQVAGRVRALGGSGAHGSGSHGDHSGGGHRDHPHEHVRFEGKIAGVQFDSFGDFEGFWLRTKDGLHELSSRERDMEALVTRAWRQQVALLVIVERHALHRPISIVLLRASSPE
jgi:hypothetical protein